MPSNYLFCYTCQALLLHPDYFYTLLRQRCEEVRGGLYGVGASPQHLLVRAIPDPPSGPGPRWAVTA